MKKVTLMLEVEVADVDRLYRAAFALSGREAGDEREAVVQAVVGDDLDTFGEPRGLNVTAALAKWSAER